MEQPDDSGVSADGGVATGGMTCETTNANGLSRFEGVVDAATTTYEPTGRSAPSGATAKAAAIWGMPPASGTAVSDSRSASPSVQAIRLDAFDLEGVVTRAETGEHVVRRAACVEHSEGDLGVTRAVDVSGGVAAAGGGVPACELTEGGAEAGSACGQHGVHGRERVVLAGEQDVAHRVGAEAGVQKDRPDGRGVLPRAHQRGALRIEWSLGLGEERGQKRLEVAELGMELVGRILRGPFRPEGRQVGADCILHGVEQLVRDYRARTGFQRGIPPA